MVNVHDTLEELDRKIVALPVATLHQFDALCDGYEREFSRNHKSKIEEFVAPLTPEQRPLAVLEFVRIEMALVRERGEDVAVDAYVRRFPENAGEIRALADEILRAPEPSTTDASTIRSLPSAQQTLLGGSTSWPTSDASLSWMALPADGRLGNYQLEEVLGSGAMGKVFRARDLKLNRTVAIKLLSPAACRVAQARERFLREAKSSAIAAHPNIVTLYSVEEFNALPFLVLEYVAGVTLDAKLKIVGALPIPDVINLGRQIAEGLEAAHRQGLIHRDIKPGNILLENDGNAGRHVKLTDFGLARAVSDPTLTASGTIVGTPQYMSPEQANGKEVDHRSDLFSLGSVLYRALAGQPPFQAESAIAILRQVSDLPAPSVREVRPDTPDWLVNVVERLLAKNPSDRIGSASALVEIFRSQAIAPTKPSVGQNAWRKPVLLLVSSVLLAMAAVVVTNRGEFEVRISDEQIAARLDTEGALVVEDRATKQSYRLKRGDNILPTGDYDLQVTTPHGLSLDTPTFQIKRGGHVVATVIAPQNLANAASRAPVDLKTHVFLAPGWRWTEPQNLGPGINTPRDERHPTITADGLTLVFLRDWKVWQADRKNPMEMFGEPVCLTGPLNDDGNVDGPFLSEDGLSMWFASNRKGSAGHNDLWVVQRSSRQALFSKPVRLGPSINTPGEESTPSVSADGLTLHFCAIRDGEQRGADIYTATRTSHAAPFSAPTHLRGPVNGSSNDFFPRLVGDGRILVFTTTFNNQQLFRVATRTDATAPFGAPVPLDHRINAGIVSAAAIQQDGAAIIFDCIGRSGMGKSDLWIARRLPAN